MPTEIARSPAYIPRRCKVHDIGPRTVAATFAFVMLHLLGGVIVEHSQAGERIEPQAFAAPDDDAKCAAEPRPPEPTTPYD